jgi:hypothetical protein
MTKRLADIMRWVQDYEAAHGKPPYYAQAAAWFGTTKSGMYFQYRRLEKLGYIRFGYQTKTRHEKAKVIILKKLEEPHGNAA